MRNNLNDALRTLQNDLISSKNDAQITLFNLATLKQGKQFTKNIWKSVSDDEWQTIVENMMWKVDHIIPADKAFSDCNTYGDYNDFRFLINHDGNFSFYVKSDYVSSDKTPKAISKKTANKVIDYVNQHLSDIKNFVNTDEYCFNTAQQM